MAAGKKEAKVETYDLIAANGRLVRKATKVTLPGGAVVRFTERLGKRQAVEQALEAARLHPAYFVGQ